MLNLRRFTAILAMFIMYVTVNYALAGSAQDYYWDNFLYTGKGVTPTQGESVAEVWKNSIDGYGDLGGCLYIGTWNNALFTAGLSAAGSTGTNILLPSTNTLEGKNPRIKSLSLDKTYFAGGDMAVCGAINDNGYRVGVSKRGYDYNKNYFLARGKVDPYSYQVPENEFFDFKIQSDFAGISDFWGNGSSATRTNNGGGLSTDNTFGSSVMVAHPTSNFFLLDILSLCKIKIRSFRNSL